MGVMTLLLSCLFQVNKATHKYKTCMHKQTFRRVSAFNIALVKKRRKKGTYVHAGIRRLFRLTYR